MKELLGATVEVVKEMNYTPFVVIPQRWVVERSFGWLENAADSGKIVNANLPPVCR